MFFRQPETHPTRSLMLMMLAKIDSLQRVFPDFTSGFREWTDLFCQKTVSVFLPNSGIFRRLTLPSGSGVIPGLS